MNTRILSNVLRSLFLPLFIALQAGCSPILVVKAEGEVPPPALHDGLSASPAPLILGSPERWEVRLREECENDPGGSACARLFDWAAGQLRRNTQPEAAAGLLAHACAQRHAPSCAAVELLKFGSLNNAEAMVRTGCPNSFAFPGDCYGAGAVLIHVCNERHQAAACLQLAELFAKADEPDQVWAKRYRDRACKYGNFCSPQDQAPRKHTVGAE